MIKEKPEFQKGNLPTALGLTEDRAWEIYREVREIAIAASDSKKVMNAAIAIKNIEKIFSGLDLIWAIWCIAGIAHSSKFKTERGSGVIIIGVGGSGDD
jgi:hypothetical protein